MARGSGVGPDRPADDFFGEDLGGGGPHEAPGGPDAPEPDAIADLAARYDDTDPAWHAYLRERGAGFLARVPSPALVAVGIFVFVVGLANLRYLMFPFKEALQDQRYFYPPFVLGVLALVLGGLGLAAYGFRQFAKRRLFSVAFKREKEAILERAHAAAGEDSD